MPRMVHITKRGEVHEIAVTEHDFETAGVGPNGETYKDLGYRIDRYEDTDEPYKAPKTEKADEPKGEKGKD